MTLFDKIIAGEIPSKKIWEDDDVYVFLDISQATKGHTLVVPKISTPSVLTADPTIVAKINVVAQQIGIQLMEIFDAKGVNILTNANEISGQTIPHYHVHVIPRYSEDELEFITKPSETNLEQVYQTIQDAFQGIL